MIRVMVVDDHAGVRNLLKSLLKRAPDIDVVGEAKNGMEALSLVDRINPDVMLLDIEMPGLNGMDVARELQIRKSRVVILAISAYNDEQYIFRMLDSGAAGYLVKEEVPDNLIIAVRDVALGKRNWITEERRRRVEARRGQYSKSII